MDQYNVLTMFPDMGPEEMQQIMMMMQGMTETQQQNFLLSYKGRRRDKTLMLVLALLGFFGVAGIHRFLSEDYGLGILYVFTAGLCFIGTIVDVININEITLKYNLSQAIATANFVKMMR